MHDGMSRAVYDKARATRDGNNMDVANTVMKKHGHSD